MKALVLLIDDDLRLTAMVADYLQAAGLATVTAPTLAAGRERLLLATSPGGAGGRLDRVDLVVLDLMLPDGDGLDLCRWLRQQPSLVKLPVLMLSARGEPTDRIVGLELGADDYLAKPFEPRELLARAKALLRRHGPSASDGADDVIDVGSLRVDLGSRTARVSGRRCELTAHQFDLLAVLARHAGRVLSREQIMEALKGQTLDVFDRSIDVHVSRIRATIEDDPKNPRRLLTLRNAGYLLTATPDDKP